MTSKNNDQTFLDKVREILENGDRRRPCYPVEALAFTLDDTKRNVKRKVFMYKWTGLALMTLIPILSAVISTLLPMKGSGDQNSRLLLEILSFSLTLLTILNSIFKPGERFRSICSLGIRVDDLGDQVLERLEELVAQGKIDERSLLAIVDRHRRQLDSYRELLIDLFLPEASKLPGRRSRAKGMSGSKTTATEATATKTRRAA